MSILDVDIPMYCEMCLVCTENVEQSLRALSILALAHSANNTLITVFPDCNFCSGSNL